MNYTRFFGKLTEQEVTEIPIPSVGDAWLDSENRIRVRINEGVLSLPSGYGNIVMVESMDNFPAATAGIIYLENKTYIINNPSLETTHRFVCTVPCFIGGFSSESSKLVRTVDDGFAFITGTETLDLGDITITAPLALDLDGTGVANAAADWGGVNFQDCAVVGTVKSFTNFIGFGLALLNSQGLTFTGSIDTVAFDTTIFANTTLGAALIFDENLTINRRIRIQFSAFVAVGAGKSIEVNPLASIPNDSYILFRNNFSGGGQYINGVQSNDNKADFEGNKGISNSGSSVTFYVDSAQASTTISNTNDFFPLNVDWLEGSVIQRFSIVGNQITYNGGITGLFEIFANISIISGNNNQIELEISKNGVPIVASKSISTAGGNGRSENIPVSTIVELTSGDVITFDVRNATGENNVTVQSANGKIIKL